MEYKLKGMLWWKPSSGRSKILQGLEEAIAGNADKDEIIKNDWTLGANWGSVTA